MRFEALDSWRGFCALLVALLHFKFATHLYALPPIRNAYLLVDFFFVLSGFVITHSYSGKIQDGRGFWRFALKRFGRLWPLHVATLALFVGFQLLAVGAQAQGVKLPQPPFTGTYSVTSLWTNLLFLHPFLEAGTSWNYPSWSIAVEFWTYLTFGLVVMFLPVRMRPAAAIILITAATSILYVFSPSGIAVANWLGFFRCVAGFFVGSLVYIAFASDGAPRIKGSLWEILVTVVIVVFLFVAGKTKISLFAPFIFGAAVYIFASEKGLLSRWMKRPIFLLLGKLSFSIYMVHAFIHMCMFQAFRVVGQILDRPVVFETARLGLQPGDELVLFQSLWAMDLAMVFYVVTVVICAYFLNRLVEAPGQKPFNHIAAGRSATVV